MVGRGWVRPAEFWCLSPGEVWMVIDAMTAQASPQVDPDEMRQMMDLAQAEDDRAARTGRAPDYRDILI